MPKGTYSDFKNIRLTGQVNAHFASADYKRTMQAPKQKFGGFCLPERGILEQSLNW